MVELQAVDHVNRMVAKQHLPSGQQRLFRSFRQVRVNYRLHRLAIVFFCAYALKWPSISQGVLLIRRKRGLLQGGTRSPSNGSRRRRRHSWGRVTSLCDPSRYLPRRIMYATTRRFTLRLVQAQAARGLLRRRCVLHGNRCPTRRGECHGSGRR